MSAKVYQVVNCTCPNGSHATCPGQDGSGLKCACIHHTPESAFDEGREVIPSDKPKRWKRKNRV